MRTENERSGVLVFKGDPGQGEGVLAFHEHHPRPVVRHPIYFGPPRGFEATISLTGRTLSENEPALEARDSDTVVRTVEAHALVALRMLEAVRDDKPQYFESLAKAMREARADREKSKSAVATAGDEDLLRIAIADAAERVEGPRRPPFLHEVAEEYARLRAAGGDGQASDSDVSKLRKKLTKVGYDWLPSRSRGKPKK